MNSEVSGKQHSCGSQSNSAREGDEHGRIWVQDSAGSIPGQMRKQQDHRTEGQERQLAALPCHQLIPCFSELQVLSTTRLLDLRVSLGPPNSAVHLPHSIGVWKQGVPPEFPRSPGGMWSCEGWGSWIMGTSLLLWAGNLVLTNVPCTWTLLICLLVKNDTKT